MNFLPARVHVKENPEDFKRYSERYSAPWTPTILEGGDCPTPGHCDQVGEA